MLDRPLVATTDWLRCEMVVDVPHAATVIIIGAHLNGTGKVWFTDLKIEEVASTPPTTDCYAMGCV